MSSTSSLVVSSSSSSSSSISYPFLSFIPILLLPSRSSSSSSVRNLNLTFMEEESESAASSSWWLDSRNRPSNLSPWLQAILSDLDEKIRTVVNLIEDEGDSFTERAELFYKRRPELLSVLRDLHQSYQNLAENYDKIRSAETARVAQLRSPFSSLRFREMSLTKVKTEEESPNPDPQPQTSLTKVKTEEGSPTPDPQPQTSAVEDAITEGTEAKEALSENEGEGEKENTWEEVKPKVSKLIDDNLRQQTELIRRNDEKREMIKQLRGQICRLVEENRAMKSFISGYKVEFKQTDSNHFKLKGLNCLGN
ncbi:protein NETWORKED 3A-like [Euphorbia lathyris]|uniref:protein NETWORKED 3A-like n=1 Tax=Euphorbia lathyris TaxID=212925 RepID=UPI00331443DF